MLEKKIEQKLVRKVKSLSGLCLKWSCPGTNGVPDRIVLMPTGKIWFVETKSDKGVCSPIQKYTHKLLGKLGFTVFLVHSEDSLNDFLRHAEQN